MLNYQMLITSRRSSVILRPTIHRFYSFLFPSEDKDVDAETRKSTRQLKKWRTNNIPENDSILGMFDTKSEKDSFMGSVVPSFKTTNLKTWYKAKQLEYLKWSQRYIEERHRILGNQLAITHFVLFRGGKVKQKGAAEFLCPDDIHNLPSSFTPNWFIEEIDFSDSDICYEGLDNFRDIRSLRKISFKGCKYFDDWCLEKFISQCPKIEYLDVSDCENVSERGIEGLYRSWYLKHLVVTDAGHGAAFELTCLMLEDCMPGLKVEIIKAPISNKDVQ